MNQPFDREEQIVSRKAKIIACMERLSTLFRASLQERSKQLSLSPLQIQIILFIAYHAKRSCNTSSIAEEFAITKPTVSDAIRVLIEKKLLLKKQRTKDARAFVLQLSVKGKKILNALSDITADLNYSLETAKPTDIESIWSGILLLMQQLQQIKTIPMRMCFNCHHYMADYTKDTPHYCQLMEIPLLTADIRIDCSDHKALIVN